MIWSLVALISAQIDVPCNNPRIRKDFRDYSDAEWNNYSDAVKKLKDTGDLSKYAGLHYKIYDSIHTGKVSKPQFLTWHRAFIYSFESKLREVSGKPITLPYIDFATEADVYQGKLEKSPAFTGYYYGQMKGNCLSGNIYKTFTLRKDFADYAKHPCIYNKFNSKQAVGGWSTVDSQIVNNKDFTKFEQAIEQGVHFNVHTRIGGVMILKISPMHPVFFAHHSFIDMVFSTWQYVHNKWTNMPTSFAKSSFNILGTTYTHEQVFRMDRMCVKYQRYKHSTLKRSKLKKRLETMRNTPVNNRYPKPAVYKASPNDSKAYNQKLKSYYSDIKRMLAVNNSSQSTSQVAYKKSIKIYGNNSFIPIFTSVPTKLLKGFGINVAEYQQTIAGINQRNLNNAKQNHMAVTIGNKTTKNYKKASTVLAQLQASATQLLQNKTSAINNATSSLKMAQAPPVDQSQDPKLVDNVKSSSASSIMFGLSSYAIFTLIN